MGMTQRVSSGSIDSPFERLSGPITEKARPLECYRCYVAEAMRRASLLVRYFLSVFRILELRSPVLELGGAVFRPVRLELSLFFL